MSMCTCKEAPLQKLDPLRAGVCAFQKFVIERCDCQYTHIVWPDGTVNEPLVGNVNVCKGGGFVRPVPGGVQPFG
jgi:hypothetical protein